MAAREPRLNNAGLGYALTKSTRFNKGYICSMQSSHRWFCLVFAAPPPLPKKQLEEIDALQQKKLRSIVGWYRVEREAWSDTKITKHSAYESQKFKAALRQSPVTAWSGVFRSTRHSFGARFVKQNAWLLFAASRDTTRHNNFATQPKKAWQTSQTVGR